MDTITAIIIVMIILIGYYIYSKSASTANTNNNGGSKGNSPTPNAPCNVGQVCLQTCGSAIPTNMYEFIFEYKCDYSYAVFDDVGQSEGGDNQVHFMTIEDTSKVTSGSGIIYQYFIPSNSSTFFGGSAAYGITSTSPYAMLICPSTYNQTSPNSISKYVGIVVNYTFSNTSLSYTRENVMNPSNIKNISNNISNTHGGATTSTYLGSCDLTPWYNNLSATDQKLVGTCPSATFSSIRLGSDACIDPSSQDITIIGTKQTIFGNKGSHPYGVSIFSYSLNSSIITPPCPALFDPESNDIGVTYL